MFEKLHDLTPAALAAGADALQEDGRCAAIVDRSGVFVGFRATTNHEVDFACCTLEGKRWRPAGLTPMQFAVIQEWAKRNVPALCRTWVARHPEDRHGAETPWKLP